MAEDVMAVGDAELDALAERARALAQDRRAWPGDTAWRVSQQGKPSPSDIVSLLVEAAAKDAAGVGATIGRSVAEQALRWLASRPWRLSSPAAGTPASPGDTLGYKQMVVSGERQMTLSLRRWPAPHVWRVELS